MDEKRVGDTESNVMSITGMVKKKQTNKEVELYFDPRPPRERGAACIPI